MPEKQKARFRDGMWVKADDLPEHFDRYSAGQDFGLNITFVKIGWVGEVIYVLCDYGAYNMTTQSFDEELNAAAGWTVLITWEFRCIAILRVGTYSGNARRGGIRSWVVFDLFHRPNKSLSRFELWRETAAWWFLEGEAFCWFGSDYPGGLPKEIYILDPRRMRHEGEFYQSVEGKPRRWFYHTDTGLIPILADELIHFRDWNPWNPIRGVNPLVSLSLELEQDYYASKANSQLLKHNAIPQGILKTEQTLRPEEAEQLERRWEGKYGSIKAGRKIAVLGKGTSFEPLSFTPEVVKLFELKRWNLYTILAKYGIPPRVANISDRSTALSGKDTTEQHSGFWKYTLIPTLKQYEQILETQFFIRFGLKEQGIFNLNDIPELQESEDAQSKEILRK